MKKVTEQDIKNLKDALQYIVTTVLENAEADCETIEDFYNFDYKITENDLIRVLQALRVDVIKIIQINEVALDYYSFSD